jgi:hypothetical protein
MTSRRGFLASLAAAFVADPERLLWVPGAKTISVPAALPLVREYTEFGGIVFSVGDIVTLGGAEPSRFIVTHVNQSGYSRIGLSPFRLPYAAPPQRFERRRA